MDSNESIDLKKTPLHDEYSDLPGVKLVDFGGWEMPLQFAGGILAEHRAVREGVGLFDVSHMGEISITGSEAESFLDYLLPNAIAGAEEGRCIYTPMCREDGGTVDDLLVYVMGNDRYLLVVNAANTDKDFQWIRAKLTESGKNALAENVSDAWVQLALQGPGAESLLTPLAPSVDVYSLEYYRHTGMTHAAVVPALLSRTGYTGEDGFELYCNPKDAPRLWKALIEAGAVPCGLGARDILRLEAALPLYGHELADDISPIEAGLGMFVKMEKGPFIGRDVLANQKENGAPRRLYGLEMMDSGVPREGYAVFAATNGGDNAPAAETTAKRRLGFVTSGGKSPARGAFIALALLERGLVKIGDEVDVEIRGKKKRARVVKKPFYRRGVPS